MHYSNLLEAESRTGYSCSVPINIIIGVDNCTLRNGTEQSLEMAKHIFFFYLKNNQRTGKVTKVFFS